MTARETDISEDIQTVDESPKSIESTEKSIQKNTIQNVKEEEPIQNWDNLVREVENAKYTFDNTTIKLGEWTYTNTETITWNNTKIVLTIDGNGQTINGNQTQVFIINAGCSLILKNITITNAKAEDGGAIHNQGTLTITNTTLQNNNATQNGGAIYNNEGTLTITNNTTLNNNSAIYGGAIVNNGTYRPACYNLSVSNFTRNNASYGAAIYCEGDVVGNISVCNFTKNTALNKETLDLQGTRNLKGNSYYSTDILLKTINLTVKDDQNVFSYGEDVVLNFSIELEHPDNYNEDILYQLDDITLYINGVENVTTGYANYTLSNLKAGKYEVNYTSCGSTSNTVNFKVIGNSKISADKQSYDYYEGIKDTITLNITDESGEKGNLDIRVKDGGEYIELLTYHNVKGVYNLSTAALAEALENINYTPESSYTINVTYTEGDYVIPSSTNFTLNIIKLRNTSIIYDIINNTEGNVQINLTVIDAVNHSVIEDAKINVTGDITTETTNGILKNTTLTEGTYTINVTYNQTTKYKESRATIELTVEIDKNAKIEELKNNITNLTTNKRSKRTNQHTTKQHNQSNK